MSIVATRRNPIPLSILMQLLDLVTFIPAITIWGISGETNIIMGWVYSWGGTLGIAGVKALGIAYMISLLRFLDGRRSRLAPLAHQLIGIVGALGVATNILAIWVSL